MATLTEQILSNDYRDFIVPYNTPDVFGADGTLGLQFLDSRYRLIHDRNDNPSPSFWNMEGLFSEYPFVPKLFTLLSTVSLENSGIIQAQTQPVLNLAGRGVLLGFLDTGIDYTHPAFRDGTGRTRITGIWDQTIQDGSNNLFRYGTMYTREQIDEALQAEDPYSLVPSLDRNGHGTFLAGVAAGSPDPASEFTGAAYEAAICVVKLKEAKEYLRNYYFVSPDSIVYQENDLMMGINYLLLQGQNLRMPVVVCIGLGTNQGDHAGNSPLSKMITQLSYTSYTNFVIAAGNEGGRAHHYYNRMENGSDLVEIRVPEGSPGFVSELWGSTTSLLSVGLQSPLGTQIAPIPARPGKTEEISFVLEQTRITVSYFIVSESGGDQLILLRFQDPTPGNWIIRVYSRGETGGSFHMWLPVTGLLEEDVTFLNPNPNTTLTVPSDARDAITTAAYNAYNQSLYIHSGRGYTRTGEIKPYLASPGVDITGPNLQLGYTNRTGSSGAAAILGGSAALLQEWAQNSRVPYRLNSMSMTSYLVRGAKREPGLEYPNREWGYGKLDVYGIFTSLMG